MEHARIKLAITAVALAGAVSYLAVAGAKKGWVYYLDVDALVSTETYQDQRVRLCGRVAEEQLMLQPGNFQASFLLVGKDHRIPVVYRGVVPEMFAAGRDVVLEGELDQAGVFQADLMMTKCASKYQSEEHAKRLETGT